MTLALNSEFPLLDIGLSMLLVFGLALFLWLLVVVLRDLFGRTDLAAWGKALWVVVLLVFPLAGALGYLIVRGPVMGQRGLRQDPGTELRSVAGTEGFYGVHDVAATREAMIGPMRPV